MLYMLDNLVRNFEKFPHRNAFYIRDRFHTYAAFASRIASIRQQVTNSAGAGEQYFGIITYDDLETYASIYALWFLGKAYVPLNPDNPRKRNMEIISQVGIRTILTSQVHAVVSLLPAAEANIVDTSSGAGQEAASYAGINIQVTSTGAGQEVAMPAGGLKPLKNISDDACYVLFTSGSTGRPKGVPISRRNLDTFVRAFLGAGYALDENDRFLQIYDLSFDASVHCFTVPLTVGGCVYTVPRDQIKYLYAYKLMKEQQLTFVKMPPSTLSYLQPYFSSINLEHLRYCLLGGEAFSSQLAERWAACVPNAQIQNVYGPTEFTINSHIYNWDSTRNKDKSSNGIVSIGKCFGDTVAMVAGKDLEPLGDVEKGELCLSGNQQTRGYWKDDDQTSAAFFEREVEGEVRRFYRTGDLVYRDGDGDYMYIGRLDSQVQIQGYRVELSEIEKHAIEFLEGANVAVIPRVNENHVTELFLFVENTSRSADEISQHLEKSLPAYMVPRKVINLETFPKSAGGKINRTALKKQIPLH
ncbi:MAG: AMP-binding protein [Bacteroidales bacterium]|nr:AMP-binding protein [Bacteroidales bacterium]MDT8429932.1 AMP-binding protein [Bacteroidales bacterium]